MCFDYNYQNYSTEFINKFMFRNIQQTPKDVILPIFKIYDIIIISHDLYIERYWLLHNLAKQILSLFIFDFRLIGQILCLQLDVWQTSVHYVNTVHEITTYMILIGVSSVLFILYWLTLIFYNARTGIGS